MRVEFLKMGEYTGKVCGCSLHLNETDMDYQMECGVRASFEGKFRIKDGDVILIEGQQCFDGRKWDVQLKPDGDFMGTFKKIDM